MAEVKLESSKLVGRRNLPFVCMSNCKRPLSRSATRSASTYGARQRCESRNRLGCAPSREMPNAREHRFIMNSQSSPEGAELEEQNIERVAAAPGRAQMAANKKIFPRFSCNYRFEFLPTNIPPRSSYGRKSIRVAYLTTSVRQLENEWMTAEIFIQFSDKNHFVDFRFC